MCALHVHDPAYNHGRVGGNGGGYVSGDNFVGAMKERLIVLEDGWNTIYNQGILKLQRLIREAHTNTGNGSSPDFTNPEYIDLYSTVYQMCVQKAPHCYTAQLYEKYDECIGKYLQDVYKTYLSGASTDLLFLSELVEQWKHFQIYRKWMHLFFRYLDRFYVVRYGKAQLLDVANHKFKDIVFEKVKVKAANSILHLIKEERMGESIDRNLIRSAVFLFVEMGQAVTSTLSQSQLKNNSNNSNERHSTNNSNNNGPASTSLPSRSVNLSVYERDFQKSFLESTKEFYSGESAHWLVNDSCPEYLRKCEIRYDEEKSRIRDYLHITTQTSLLDTLHQTLLVLPQNKIIEKENTGVRALLESNAENDLKRLFRLYSQVPNSLPPISKILQQHIVSGGTAVISKLTSNFSSNANMGTVFIEDLIGVHEKFFQLVTNCFQGHTVFQKSLTHAFEQIMNTNLAANGPTFPSISELLSTYADSVLKKGGIKLNERQLQSALDAIVRLFSYLADKDLFNEFYRKQLASRLLMQRSASADAEKAIIGKLKLKCGPQFTSKLEGMINDMRIAKDASQQLKDFFESRKSGASVSSAASSSSSSSSSGFFSSIDFDVQALTSGYWPSYPVDEIKLPSEMEKLIDQFRIFYDSKTTNRKLRWIHDLGVVTMSGAFPKKRIDLQLSTVQAVILLCFNESDSPEISIDDLINRTGVSADVIKQQLKSMVNGKYRILAKVPADGYSTTHKIKVNLAFTDAQNKIRIPNALRKTTAKDREAASEAVSSDRKYAIEAAIVRLMKARKTMNHQALVSEVSAQLLNYFTPEPKSIKERIEDLIAREYMERDADKNNEYHYLA